MTFKESLRSTLKSFWNELLSYFNVAEDLEPQNEVEQSIRSSVSFKGSQLLVLIFAIFIASLGLNTDSIPVIIGAMLISPLMGPIIGMGLAIGIEDYQLLRRSLRNIVMAMIGSLLASAIYFLISPQYEGSSQLLARTSPSIYDVFVGLFGGAAGIVSIACRNKGQVMPVWLSPRRSCHLFALPGMVLQHGRVVSFRSSLSVFHQYDFHSLRVLDRSEANEIP